MSDIKLIEVPKWGMSMDEGTVTEWLIEEGASFAKGDLICEIETSKITNELEAPFDGTLRRIIAKPGDTLPVGAVLAVSADADVPDAEIERFLAGIGADEVPEPADSERSPGGQPTPAEPDVKLTPAMPAASESVPVTAAPTSTETEADTGPTIVPEALRGRTNGDVFATPHARRLADELSINLGVVPGTGRGGRISVADVHDAIRAAGGTVAPAPAKTRSPVPGRSTEDDSDVSATVETIPFTSMRKAIGQRLQESKRNAPHFRLTADLDIGDLLAVREEINATVPAVNLSVNDFIVKACAAALRKVPDVNVQFDEATQTVRRYAAADVAVAVALPSGLITPIVRGADTKTLAEISTEIQSLATRAKTGKLVPDEFEGGTFTVSNLGMYGVREFDAIINAPQAAILAVGAGQQCPVVVDGQVVVRTMLTVTLSCDHRVIDGALGATFLQELRRFVESPALMLV